MKIIHLLFFGMMLLAQPALSNNIQVSNVRLTGQDTAGNFTLVEFDISWENSWRYSGGPANWDAAWIFVKYRIGVAGPWQHALLNNTGHTSCGGATITNGFLSPALPFDVSTNPTIGVFLYRSSPGSGTFTCQDIQLRWNYGVNNVADNEEIDIKVFAIEMVYVPQGSFYVGSGGSEAGAFYTHPTTTSPYQITGEGAIAVGASSGNLFYNNTSGTSGDQLGPVPAGYPKGYAAFYIMKYELSQKAYLDFLNSLTRAQQINHVRANISGTTASNEYVMANYWEPLNRNGIRCFTAIPPPPAVVNMFCDLNINLIPNDNADGLGIPNTFMNHGDITAYLDWSGLRLMTEFEFEKCGRGPKTPLANEYAWGTNVLYKNNVLWDSGLPTEIPAEYYSNSPFADGPTRNGAFARPNSTRELSGAGYYGCQDLGGNLLEMGCSIGHPSGRAYTGVHGNGMLTASGAADVLNWPTSNGIFLRGGTYITADITQERLSDRFRANTIVGSEQDVSVRGVRTAQ